LGAELVDFERIDWPNPIRLQEGWKTEVIYVDTYGNAVTAFPAGRVHDMQAVLLSDGRRIPFAQFYAGVPEGNPLAVLGSSGFVEIAINKGAAASELGLRPGSEVIIA
jgi:S-adenosyl-L-methionine hydrolase (adenosine-forming)